CLAGSSGRAQPTAAAITSPGTSLVWAANAVGTIAPGLIRGSGTSSTPGGRMLEILSRLMLPIPAASSALSKALSDVPPSAFPAVPAAMVTAVHPMRSSLSPPCTQRSPLLERPSQIALHRSGSAEERKQKVARRRSKTALSSLVGTFKNLLWDHFLLAMPKKLAHSEKTSAPENSGADKSTGGGKECTHWGDTCCSSCST